MTERNSPTPIYVTVREAKRRLGIHRPIEAAIDAGAIPVVRAGAWRRVRLEDVVAYVDGLGREQGQR